MFFFSVCRFEGLSLRQAYEQVLEQRPFIRPNAGFWRQLINYEKTLFSRNTMRMARSSGGVLAEALQDGQDCGTSTAYCVNVWHTEVSGWSLTSTVTCSVLNEHCDLKVKLTMYLFTSSDVNEIVSLLLYEFVHYGQRHSDLGPSVHYWCYWDWHGWKELNGW